MAVLAALFFLARAVLTEPDEIPAASGGAGSALTAADAELSRLPSAEAAAAAPMTLPGEAASLAGADTSQAASAALAPGEEALFTGRVVDVAGLPIEGALIHHVPNRVLAKQLGLFADVHGRQLNWDKLAHTSTDAEGRFRLSSRELPTATQAPSSFHAPWLIASHVNFQVRALSCALYTSGSLDLGTIVLAAAGGIRGRVVDEQQRPIGGALIGPGLVGAESFAFHDGNTLLELQLLRCVSDDAGRFLLSGFREGPADSDVSHPDWAPGRIDAQAVAGQITEVGDIVLKRGGILAGVVRDANGHFVPGAKLVARPASILLFASQGATDTVLIEATTTLFVQGHHEVRGLTDENGSFLLGTLNQSHYLLSVDAAGYEPVTLRDVPAGSTNLDITVLEHATLLLRVVDSRSGEPVAGATAVARRISGSEAARKSNFDLKLEVFAGAEAAARADLPQSAAGADHPGLLLVTRAGTLRTDVVVSAPGYATRGFVLDGIAAPGRLERTLKLERESALAGRVVDEEGQPIARAKLVLAPPDNQRVTLETLTAFSDAEGRWRFGLLRSGDWTLTASAQGYLDSQPRVLALKKEEVREDLEFVLVIGASLRAYVVDAVGAPLANRVVDLRSDVEAWRGESWTGRTDSEGIAVLTGLPPGPGVVRLQYDPAEPAPVLLIAGEEAAVHLAQRKLPVVRGRVTSGGAPVSGARVVGLVAYGPSLSEEIETLTSASGDYKLELFDAASWVFFAEPPGSSQGSRSTVVKRDIAWGESALVDLSFGGGRVAGLVVDALSAEPIAEATVQLLPIHSPISGKGATQFLSKLALEVHCDEQGRFVFHQVSLGEYLLTAKATAYEAPQPLRLAVAESSSAEHKLVLQRGTRLSGAVRTASGGALPPFPRIEITPLAGGGLWFVKPDSAGDWTCQETLPPGHYSIRVRSSLIQVMADPSAEPPVLAEASVHLSVGESKFVELRIDG
ncbi:MAG: carboxypeptidase regulatory-like domain-containing protein [Planctomycetota bacterium]